MAPLAKDVRLFSEFSIEQLANWALRLKYFRVVAAEFANSGSSDNLVLTLRYDSAETFKTIMSAIGVPLKPLTAGSIQPRVGQGMTITKSQKVEFEVDGVPGIQQPCVCEINGKNVFVWGERGIVKLMISGPYAPPDNITEEDVAAAEIVERVLSPIENFIVDPPADTPNCFCPKFYPHAFSQAR